MAPGNETDCWLAAEIDKHQGVHREISSAQPAEGLSPEDTIFLFDWDDTMLPFSWILRQGLTFDTDGPISDAQQALLARVARLVLSTLETAKKFGTVVLVTNAEHGWIELTCRKFMPSLYPLLETVKMMSARTTFESPERANPCDWKLCAFSAELKQFFGVSAMAEQSRRKNILSIGDSIHEREALFRVTETMPNCRSKALKFVDQPDITQICQQHIIITNCFEQIVHHDGNLDLCMGCVLYKSN